MANLYYKPVDATGYRPVDETNPLPIKAPDGVALAGRCSSSGYIEIPGIGTAAAYADGDALGTTMFFPNLFRAGVNSGIIQSATYVDLDKESLTVDLHLFSAEPGYTPTDNAAYSPADAALVSYVGTISFDDWKTLGVNSVCTKAGLGLAMVSTAQGLWGQCVARGALNIAASNIPKIRLLAIQD